MSTQEILIAIRNLPLVEQKEILNALQQNLRTAQSSSDEDKEAQVERLLFEQGVISEIPKRLPDAEEDDFDPIEVEGKPLSETIIEERR